MVFRPSVWLWRLGSLEGGRSLCRGLCHSIRRFYNSVVDRVGKCQCFCDIVEFVEDPIKLALTGSSMRCGLCGPLLLNRFQFGFRSLPLGKATLFSAQLGACLADGFAFGRAPSGQLPLQPVWLTSAETSFSIEALLPESTY
jgi:hypothetical protein